MNIGTDSAELYKFAACGLITFQIDGTVLHANETLLNWLGIDEAEIKLKKFPDLFYKGGKLYYNLFIHPMLQMHSKVSELNIELKSAAGSFPTLFSATTHKLKSGAESVINGAFFKIADRKKYEVELMREKDIVKNENLAMTQALTDIAFNQAHLIRAPLANIMGLIGLLGESEIGDDSTRHLLQLLSKSAHNLDKVIRDIVDMSAD